MRSHGSKRLFLRGDASDHFGFQLGHGSPTLGRRFPNNQDDDRWSSESLGHAELGLTYLSRW